LQLGSAALIDEKVSFPISGPDATPGLIVMQIDDLVGDDVDPELDGALVVFNASPEPITETVDGLAGRSFELADALASGSDPVVKTTAWDAASGSLTVPARTAAVLVDGQEPPGIATSVVAVPDKVIAKAGSSLKLDVQVTAADGTPAIGTVTVMDGGEPIATAQLDADDEGRLKVKLPKLGAGLHVLTVAFDGGEGYADSQSVPMGIVLW
jgi:hypothetical protein